MTELLKWIGLQIISQLRHVITLKKQTNKAKTKEIAKRKIQQQQKDENKKLKKKKPRKPQELKGCRENEDIEDIDQRQDQKRRSLIFFI